MMCTHNSNQEALDPLIKSPPSVNPLPHSLPLPSPSPPPHQTHAHTCVFKAALKAGSLCQNHALTPRPAHNYVYSPVSSDRPSRMRSFCICLVPCSRACR
jgi:hypothetical protein